MDFTVESDNPAYKYLGKGFAELTSVEIARIPGVTLVDREQQERGAEGTGVRLERGGGPIARP